MSGGREGTAYETIDVRTRPIFGFGIALAAVVLITAGVMQWQFQFLSNRSATEQVPLHPLADEVERPPEPRLLADPDDDYHAYLSEQRERLTQPAWIDEREDLVRLPVERALELVLEEGLPAKPVEGDE